MMTRLFKLFFVCVLVAVMSACASDVRVQKLPELTFKHLGEIKLNVARLETVSKYKAPLKRPNVEHLFSAKPDSAAQRWAKDTLVMAGQTGLARFTVHEASVVEEKLQMDSSISGLFTKQQSERYTVRIEATLEVFDALAKRRGFASANAVRSTTIREDATLNERDKAWFKLIEEVMNVFDLEMKRNIKRHLVNWIR